MDMMAASREIMLSLWKLGSCRRGECGKGNVRRAALFCRSVC